ncbi:MAG: ABC transporter permease [Verrucomicrobia bacterium]|jgi:putative ABC transport system permease protein|nr:ABC transporter permease [Verrucomicrobiota bacterium]
MFFNAFILALREIRRNITRAFLTVIGVVIGVAAVVTMVTLGRGATEVVKSQISNLGSNLMILRPGQGWGQWGAPLFSIADVQAVREQVSGVRAAAPLAMGNAPAVFMENVRNTDYQGTTPEYFDIAGWKLSEGRFFDQDDLRKGAAVCVIGETIRKELFGSVPAVGQKIRIRKTSLMVIGVTAVKGQGGFGDDLDDNIILPITTMQRRLAGLPPPQNINQIQIAGIDEQSCAGILADLTLLMRERRNLADNEQNNFSVVDTRMIAETMSSSTQILTSLLGAVAGVSLLVGGIGIMNVMLVSVTERTREIGIRLAIGARARDVMLQFLVEAVTLSWVGGLAGILVAYGLCHSLAKVVGAPFVFDPKINLIAFMFSAAIGIIFGFMPARRAASLDPIDALRHE